MEVKFIAGQMGLCHSKYQPYLWYIAGISAVRLYHSAVLHHNLGPFAPLPTERGTLSNGLIPLPKYPPHSCSFSAGQQISMMNIYIYI